MKKNLIEILFLAAALITTGCFSQEKQQSEFLSQDDVSNADFVANWLVSNRNIDQTDAKRFFNRGVHEKNRKAWSSAAKSFGASMLLYPGPEALSEYIEASLKMLASVRKREGSVREKLHSDMSSALQFYRSALAANTVLGTLPTQEHARIQAYVNCLQPYVASGHSEMDCEPLRWYYNAAR